MKRGFVAAGAARASCRRIPGLYRWCRRSETPGKARRSKESSPSESGLDLSRLKSGAKTRRSIARRCRRDWRLRRSGDECEGALLLRALHPVWPSLWRRRRGRTTASEFVGRPSSRGLGSRTRTNSQVQRRLHFGSGFPRETAEHGPRPKARCSIDRVPGPDRCFRVLQ